ncbi:hypothetical protein EDM55_08385 [Brevibacillus centrosporus]|nr:hypothetical protein EDM55_08385 [Brevibacillus centrosporus]
MIVMVVMVVMVVVVALTSPQEQAFWQQGMVPLTLLLELHWRMSSGSSAVWMLPSASKSLCSFAYERK